MMSTMIQESNVPGVGNSVINSSNSSSSSSSNSNIGISHKERKDRYLSRLVNWLATNPAMDDIWNSPQNELQKDYQIANFLLASGRFHLEITRNEICTALEEARNKSAKSIQISNSYISEAEKNFLGQNYPSAVNNYSKAILHYPLVTSEDYKQLATIFYRRMKCSLELKEEKRAALDIEFIMMADPNLANTMLNKSELKLRDKFRNELGPNWFAGNESSFKTVINSGVEVSKTLETGIYANQYRYTMSAKQTLPIDSMVVMEKPFVKFASNAYDNCVRCDKTLDNLFCWPCNLCTNIVYCSKDCCEKDFEFHKYECGVTDYISQIPLMLLMLRFYVRSGQTPLCPCPVSTDFIKLYLDAVLHHGSLESHVLNAFRQSMDQHERRHILLENKHHYYAALIMAIEFLYLYDACRYNGQCISERGSGGQLPESKLNDEMVMMNNFPELPTAYESFRWAKEFESKTEMIALVFRDMKRFIASPFTKFTFNHTQAQQQQHEDQTRKRDRRLLVLSGIVFPSHNSHQLDTNVTAYHSENVGRIEMRTSHTVQSGQKLVLARKMLKI